MERKKETGYDEGYSFLMNLAMELASKGKPDRAKIIIRYMMEKWPERVIRHEDSVLAKEVVLPINPTSNP